MKFEGMMTTLSSTSTATTTSTVEAGALDPHGSTTTTRTMHKRRARRQGTTSTSMSLLLLLIVALPLVSADYFTPDSVVLITGAAGFVGSELAMALQRTYKPKKIICVDSMSHFGSSGKDDELSILDVKRQRAFHVLQTLGSKGHFYRADFRPSIPEYFDMGEVPILEYIWRDHPDITHVVHLADAYAANADVSTIQAVPRQAQDVRSGMMEALLEHLRKIKDENTGPVPFFAYASSYEVYNYFSPNAEDNVDGPVNPSPFREDKPITTPSSLRGATKLIDELIARQYEEKYGISSIGLRFFPIYGPWGQPGTPLYEMAERAVAANSKNESILSAATTKSSLDDVRDFVYIDDAVDALMTAMQLRTKSVGASVVNVGSGEGNTLRDVAAMMESILGRSKASSTNNKSRKSVPTTAVASTARAKAEMGFETHISLQQGLGKLLSWHYDRAFPYGPAETQLQGISSCSTYDKECLHGAPIFPCAAECAHETQCTTSYYDDVMAFTMDLTEACETVLYTVALDHDLVEIPSAVSHLAKDKRTHLKQQLCNIAFVSENSPLVRRLKQKHDYPFFSTVVEEFHRMEDATGTKVSLKHGFWTLVPLPVPSFDVGDEHILSLLPKLSPGAFFGAATKRAIYCDPNVIFTNLPSILEEAQMKPRWEGSEGGTALLIGHKPPPMSEQQHMTTASVFHQDKPTMQESIQAAAYRMIRIGMIDQMMVSPPPMDSTWMVHILQNDDSRLFRCDVFGEVVQWDVPKADASLQFVVGLHDMWARVIAKKTRGVEPWWIGDAVQTVHEERRRRLMRKEDDAEKEEEQEDLEKEEDVKEEEDDEEEEQEGDEKNSETEQLVGGAEAFFEAGGAKDTSENMDVPAKAFQVVELDGAAQQDEVDAALVEQEGLKMLGQLDLKNPNALEEEEDEDEPMDDTKQQKKEPEDESTNTEEEEENPVDMMLPLKKRDVNDDTWMGMLSSTSMHYFVRIVPSADVGVVFLDESTMQRVVEEPTTYY
jgi:nucleoside-diphosphate-sugar epimerase